MKILTSLLLILYFSTFIAGCSKEPEFNMESKGDTTWHEIGALGEIGFQNSWHNVDIVNYESAAYRKDGQDIVI
jgi:hypothetical protein